MNCSYCNRTGLTEDDFFGPRGMCGACFEKMMADEDEAFAAYNDQGGKCFHCGVTLHIWAFRDGHAVCFQDCKKVT